MEDGISGLELRDSNLRQFGRAHQVLVDAASCDAAFADGPHDQGLAARGALPDTYLILELSADLRERQAATIEQTAPEHAARVRWLDRLPEPGFRGLVLANELLDSMPVERFKVAADGVKRMGVTWRDASFSWVERPAPSIVAERVHPLMLVPGYVSEIGLAAQAWVRSIGERVAAGVLLFIDYGFPRAEFYHPDRATGTLMCHYRHRAHTDPLILPGLQDITAHVDFTAITQAGTDIGLDLLGYTSQAAFLLGRCAQLRQQRARENDRMAALALPDG